MSKMIIGLDFDNTIVCYNEVFHTLAIQKGVIPEDIPAHKIAIRDYLRGVDKESIWTHMQGEVYGTMMKHAKAFPLVSKFIESAQSCGHAVYIVSHKTKYPFIGPKWDLHGPAKEWIDSNIQLEKDHVFLEPTKESKLNRIGELKCDVFVDDLPEILTNPLFPKQTKPILFDPDHLYDQSKLLDLEIYTSWKSIFKIIGNCEINR